MNSINSTSLILISIGAFFFFTKPMLADLSLLSDQKTQYEDTLVKLNSIEEIKKGLTEKLNNIPEDQKKEIETMLPDYPGTIKLIADISAAAAKQNISIDRISYANKNSDQAASIASAPAAKPYKSIVLDFTFVSDYTHLKNFLSDLEGSLRLIDIRSIDLVTGEKGVNNYQVTAEVYSLNSNPS